MINILNKEFIYRITIAITLTTLVVLITGNINSQKIDEVTLNEVQMEKIELIIDEKVERAESRQSNRTSELERRMDESIEGKIIDVGSYMSNKTKEAGEALKEGVEAAKEKYNEDK